MDSLLYRFIPNVLLTLNACYMLMHSVLIDLSA